MTLQDYRAQMEKLKGDIAIVAQSVREDGYPMDGHLVVLNGLLDQAAILAAEFVSGRVEEEGKLYLEGGSAAQAITAGGCTQASRTALADVKGEVV